MSACDVQIVYLPKDLTWEIILEKINLDQIAEYCDIDDHYQTKKQQFKTIKENFECIQKYGTINATGTFGWNSVNYLQVILRKFGCPMIEESVDGDDCGGVIINLNHYHSGFINLMELFFKEQDEKGVLKIIQKLKIIDTLKEK